MRRHLSILGIALLLAGAAAAQTDPMHYNKTPTATPTKHEKTPTSRPTKIPTGRPTETPIPTPTATARPTWTPTSSPTPTKTRRPEPTDTPTPYMTPTETPIPTATPPPPPTPECGHACIPSFVKVGEYFVIPDLPHCANPDSVGPHLCDGTWRVIEILPSGWIHLREDQAPGVDIWADLSKIKVMIPVWVVGIQ